jgi:hypothetical protein
MNSNQKRDLELIQKITPNVIYLQTERSTDLLGARCNNPPHSLLPDKWDGGFCVGWYYAVPYSFANALDIMLTKRTDKKTKKEFLIWSQGSAFYFPTGYTVHTVPQRIGQAWGEMLKTNESSLQVQESIPAVPAHIDITTFFLSDLDAPLDKPAQEQAANPFNYEFSWNAARKVNPKSEKDPKTDKKPLEDAEELRVFVPRNAGRLTYCYYVRSSDGTGMIPHHKASCTQDDFVRILITGEEAEV